MVPTPDAMLNNVKRNNKAVRLEHISEQQSDAIFNDLQQLQQRLVAALAALDGAAITEHWQSTLGSGTMCAFNNGTLFERGGVNFSRIRGEQLPTAASVRHPQLAGKPYHAGGVSLVLHPHNPYCPTVHLNVRWFNAEGVWWCGGGMDLTPYYGFVEDCRHFHHHCRLALDVHDTTLYPRFKKNCDDYFFIRHRNEARGVGGIFFDDFNEQSFAHSSAVMQAVGDAFLPAYLPLLEKRRNTPYNEHQRDWQQHRRGRYVEFNLVYDRGTLFGLQAGGRADAILMSLPPSVCWGQPKFAIGEAEQALLRDFLPPQNWLPPAS